jgi:hypothetical protein
MHLAARRAESTRQTKTERKAVVRRRLVCAIETGTREPRLELGLCERADARR